MLHVDSLDKSFGSKQVLSQISLDAANGRITALVGANGAGKSTLIGVICGYYRAEGGSITHDTISVMPDADNLYRDMTGQQFLSFIAGIKGAHGDFSYWHRLAIRLGLRDQLKKKIKSYSFGMKKKISFIQACIGNYDTYIFDEPTSGVDVQSSLIMMRIIGELKTDGPAILLTSHNMDELQRISDYVYFIERGTIAKQGTVSELIEESNIHTGETRFVIAIRSDVRKALQTYLAQQTQGSLHTELSSQGVLITAHEDIAVTPLLKGLLDAGFPITGFWQQRATLEQALFESQRV